MKLYWAPQTRSTRALWMLEETGVSYECQLVDIQDPERSNTDEFLDALVPWRGRNRLFSRRSD